MNPRGITGGRRLLNFLVVIGLGLAVFSTTVVAAERQLPDTIQPGIQYLLNLTGDARATTVDPRALKPVLDFIRKEKSAGDQYYAASDDLLDPLVYHEFTVRQPLARILEYAFNPRIPSHVLALSSIRQSYWKNINGQSQPFPQDIADRLADLPSPLVIHGIEHEEIAPDLNSGAYYSYDLDRTLVMCQVEGRAVWISLARQRDLSDVGRKGFVLGPANGWDYLYSGEKGISIMGLGWVETYMYDAFSAIVYVQENDSTPLVRCGIFKWLRAGWSDMNFVKRSHIRRGLERYADAFQEILEAPQLPAPSSIAAVAGKISGMSRAQLQDRARRHLLSLQSRFGSEKDFPDKWFTQAVQNGTYLEQLTRPQLEAMVFLDYMKAALGRGPAPASNLAMGRAVAGEATP